jgi:hypothetical protein
MDNPMNLKLEDYENHIKSYEFRFWSSANEHNPNILINYTTILRKTLLNKAVKINASVDDVNQWLYYGDKFLNEFSKIMTDYNGKKSQNLWEHKEINPIKNKDNLNQHFFKQLKSLTIDYLKNENLQNNYYDWILLDSLFLLETEIELDKTFTLAIYGAHFENAAAYNLSNGSNFLYFLLLPIFWLLRIFFTIAYNIGLIYGIYYFYINENIIIEIILSILLIKSFINLVYFSNRKKIKKRNMTLFEARAKFYSELNSTIISPVKLMEIYNQIASLAADVDSSILSLIHNIYERDKTAFIRESI